MVDVTVTVTGCRNCPHFQQGIGGHYPNHCIKVDESFEFKYPHPDWCPLFTEIDVVEL